MPNPLPDNAFPDIDPGNIFLQVCGKSPYYNIIIIILLNYVLGHVKLVLNVVKNSVS